MRTALHRSHMHWARQTWRPCASPDNVARLRVLSWPPSLRAPYDNADMCNVIHVLVVLVLDHAEKENHCHVPVLRYAA
eukprot:2116636-Pyramimonas_sp.AAC.1